MNIRNSEFKAKVAEIESYEQKLATLNPVFQGMDHQVDTYFQVPHGRLKLREGNIENALINYDRENIPGSKESHIILYQHQPDPALKQILAKQFGVKVVVDKKRRIYFIGHVKFHFDVVENLGTFLEVEAIDTSEAFTTEELREQCDYYFNFFGLTPEHLVDRSYSDLILDLGRIDQFISALSMVQKTGNTTNLYFGDSRESQIRRNNLTVYLNKMKTRNPKILLLGEAPGYRGGRLSGLAFTSERILSEDAFFRGEPIEFINHGGQLETEIAATIVWEEISGLEEKPLIWNIFPFHPHSADGVESHRTPTRAELEEGRTFLELLLEIFPVEKIIALGRHAASQLESIGIPFTYVRHPSNGGKTAFLAGLRAELAN